VKKNCFINVASITVCYSWLPNHMKKPERDIVGEDDRAHSLWSCWWRW